MSHDTSISPLKRFATNVADILFIPIMETSLYLGIGTGLGGAEFLDYTENIMPLLLFAGHTASNIRNIDKIAPLNETPLKRLEIPILWGCITGIILNPILGTMVTAAMIGAKVAKEPLESKFSKYRPSPQ